MKPCRQCGTSLPNGAKQCEQCGAEQKEMSVKPFKPADAPPPEPMSKSEEFLSILLEIGIWAIPIVLGLVGHHFFGSTGAVIGIIIGVSPWLFANFG